MQVGAKLKGLFWSDEAAPAPAPAPAPVPRAPTGESVVGATDFAAVYARTSTAGDPRVDQVFAAFESMKAAMPAPQLAVAIAATAKAIGAEPAALVETFTKRLRALEAAVAEEQQRSAERRAGRTTELGAATTKVQAEIAAMKQRIGSLEQQLAAATQQVQQQNANEQGLVAAFEQRARAEAARVIALRDVLAAARS